jgi:hypothetical protein
MAFAKPTACADEASAHLSICANGRAFAKPLRPARHATSFRETATSNGQHLQLSRNHCDRRATPPAFAKPPPRTASTCSFRETVATGAPRHQLSRNRHLERPAPAAFAKPLRPARHASSFRETGRPSVEPQVLALLPNRMRAAGCFGESAVLLCCFRESGARGGRGNGLAGSRVWSLYRCNRRMALTPLYRRPPRGILRLQVGPGS